MAEFLDNTGHRWAVPDYTIEDVRKLRDRLGINIGLSDGSGLKQIFDDVLVAADVLYLHVGGTMDAKEFGRRIGSGDVLETAILALKEAIYSFFPKAQRDRLESIESLGKRILAEEERAIKELTTARDFRKAAAARRRATSGMKS